VNGVTEPKVSICLPTFNGEKFLRQALDSVLNQTVEDIEVVIVDDCSEDHTREILRRYEGLDQRVRVIFNEQKLGCADNFDKALTLCTGRFVKPLWQEDVLKPDCLKRMLSAIVEFPKVALVSVSLMRVDDDGAEIEAQHSFEASSVFPGQAIIKLYLREIRNRIGSISQILFRTEDMPRGLKSAYDYSRDTEFALRLCQLGDLSYLAEPLVLCRVGEPTAAASPSPSMSFALEQMRLVDSFAPYLVERGITKEKIWRSTVRGLIEKMSGLVMDCSDRQLQISFGQCQFTDDADPKVFERLAGYMMKYVSDKHAQVEESLLQAKRQRLSVADENEQLLKRMKGLEEEVFNQNLACENVKHAAVVLQEDIAKLKTSKSWKLTKPLRKLRRTP
jgi:hypothetical protein